MAQILVIEDNETMREGISQVLQKLGHQIHSAPSGSLGLKIFEETEPDFVITDLKLEDLDGIEVLRSIKNSSPDTLIMLITAFGSIETAVEAMKLGAFDFITKPFSPDLLRAKVQTAIDLIQTKKENRYLRSVISPNHISDLDPTPDYGLKRAVESFEKQFIIKAMEKTGGNALKAADFLGIKPKALYDKMEKHGIPYKD